MERLQVILEMVTGQYKREAKEAAAATDTISRSAKDTDKAIDTTASKLGGLGKAAIAGAGIAAVGAVASFAAGAVKAFSEVEQSAGSVEAVFGASADSIIAKADGAAEAFGLSASEFQDSAALIGSMLKNQLGISADEAAGRVDDLIGKASDLAATFGGTTSEAISAIGSLLRGERDPIEKYGISMNDASIQAFALEKGLIATKDQMTPQIKAAAALELLYAQSADSAGQFADESDTLAGKQQILTAKLENAKAAIGEGLAPAVGFAADAVEILIPLVETLTSAMGGATEAANPLIDELETLTGIAPETGVGLGDVGSALAHTILPFLGPVTMGIANVNDVLGTNAEKTAEAWRGMEDARTHGIEPLTDAIGDQAEAEDNLAGKIQTTIDVRQEAFDQIRGSIDKFFALTDATDDQADAQAEVNRLVDEGKKKTPEYADAIRDLAEKSLDVEEAQLELLSSGGLTRAEFEKQRIKMGLTAAQAQILIDKYDILFTDRTATFTTVFQYRGREPTADNPFHTPGAQHGGPVVANTMYRVGENNLPELLMIPGDNGRVFSNADSQRLFNALAAPSGGGGTEVIQLQVDGRVLTEIIRRADRRWLQ